MGRKATVALAELALILVIARPMRAQQTPAPALTAAQTEGRRIFLQRCAVCHTLPTIVSKRYGPALYKEIVEDNDDNIREVIMEGRESMMPGFKYGLSRAEIDSIIEYLKTASRPARPKSTPTSKKDEGPMSTGE